MTVLRNKYAIPLTALLLIQGVLFQVFYLRAEVLPAVAPLTAFPTEIGPWHMYKDLPLEKEVQDVLKADDTLNRLYMSSPDSAAFLFIAFFKTQRSGQAPHSPKNCLPGSGWEAMESEPITIDVPGRSAPILTNRYVVAKGNEKQVVLYWYQSHDRIIAGEFAAKFWLIADSIKYRRSDSALVRVVVPVRGDGDTAAATRSAVEFVKTMFPAIANQLPA